MILTQLFFESCVKIPEHSCTDGVGGAVHQHCIVAELLRRMRRVRANFRSADEDGDDRITRNQFRSFVDANAEIAFGMSKQIKRMRAYRRAFNTLDSDGDDILTWQEYVEALRSRGGQG
mgnify:CR=1 FL=1